MSKVDPSRDLRRVTVKIKAQHVNKESVNITKNDEKILEENYGKNWNDQVCRDVIDMIQEPKENADLTIKPKEMNKRIYKLIENDINSYNSTLSGEYSSNGAIFGIFDNFFHELMDKKEVGKATGIKLTRVIEHNLPVTTFYIADDAFGEEGISFYFIFDKVEYAFRFKSFRDGRDMIYKINFKSTDAVKYSNDFIYKYLLYNALESSNLKGAYFSMPRDKFNWDIKTIEGRTFDDIYLPDDIMEDLHLFVDIYKDSDRILRYLKVGSPGVGKTESTLVIASELNLEGVTIMKTSICDKLHQKMELANVLAPTLVIFDDIDLSLGDRNKGAYSQLLGDFLDILDGTDKLSDNVGVIATTNAAHLLDLAAQRPDRFDKTLFFDDITKDNVKKIIIKSLKYNFDITDGKEITLYSDDRIVDEFYDAGVTGSHIFNSIKMLKLRYNTLKIKNVGVARIIGSIKSDLAVIAKVRKASVVKEKYERGNGTIGFGGRLPPNDEMLEMDEDSSIERSSDYA